MSNDLRNKMLQWETNPPEEVWNKIAASLDNDKEYTLSKRLSSFESQPPRHVWENINTELDAHKPNRVISIYKHHKIAFQYSTVAASLILIAILISLLVNKKANQNELAQQSLIRPYYKQNVKTSTSKDNSTIQADAPGARQTISSRPPQVEQSYRDNDPNVKHYLNAAPNNKKGGPYNALITKWKGAKDSLLDRYFVHTSENGNSVRLSSKLYDLFKCSDEWTHAECAQQIKLWQQKAANSSMFASADFTGVLELLKSMQENK